MNSFLRKYSAFTGMPIEILTKLFKFRPVIIGAPLNLNGAIFRFFYCFSSIPTIGCEIYLQDKSIYFSGETCLDHELYFCFSLIFEKKIPKRLGELRKKEILAKERMDHLLNRKWDIYSIILHKISDLNKNNPNFKALINLPAKVISLLF